MPFIPLRGICELFLYVESAYVKNLVGGKLHLPALQLKQPGDRFLCVPCFFTVLTSSPLTYHVVFAAIMES